LIFYFGVDVSIPLRIFDRNQGKQAAYEAGHHAQEKLKDAAQAQVFNDVDSAYTTVNSDVVLLPAVQAEIFGAGGAGEGHDFIFRVPAWRSVVAGFS